MDDKIRILIEALEQMPRQQDEVFTWSVAQQRETLRRNLMNSSLLEGMSPEEISKFLDQGAPRRISDVTSAWNSALSIAVAFLESFGYAEAATIVGERCRLAISHTDRWTTTTTPLDDDFVISVDSGLLGVLIRVARYISFFFAWNRNEPGRLYGRADVFPADALERLFRVYFRSLRFGGVFSTKEMVNNPESELVNRISFYAFLFVLLHEIGHVLISLGVVPQNRDENDELACDALAVEMICCVPGEDPGIIALGVRHFFAVQRCIEGALYMISPSSHPSAERREREAAVMILSTIGSTGAVGWSRMAYTPMLSLIKLANMTFPWADMETKLSEVYDWARPKFEIVELNESDDTPKLILDFQENADCGIHQPPDLLASELIEAMNQFLSEGDDLAGCPLELVELARGQEHSSELGWTWIDRFIELNHDTLQEIWRNIPSSGLRYCDYYWYRCFRELGPGWTILFGLCAICG